MTKSELYYKIAEHRVLEQDRRRQHFDGVATALLAVSAALIGVPALTTGWWSSWSVFLATFIFLGFVATAVFAVFEIRLGKWHAQPRLDDLEAHVRGPSNDTVLTTWAARQMRLASLGNEPILKRKAHYSTAAHWSFVAEAVALGVFVFSLAW